MLQEKVKQDMLLETEKAARQSAETTAASLQVELQDATCRATVAEQVQAITLNKSYARCKCVAKSHAC